MKKIALLAALIMLVSATAHAATAVAVKPEFTTGKMGVSVTSADSKPIGKLSASVSMGYKGDATGYAIDTQHQKGTKAFGTSHDSTAIYSTDVATGTAAGDLGSSNSTSFDSWTAM